MIKTKLKSLRDKIAEEIASAIPDNPNIQRLSHNPSCFVVMLSEVKKRNNMSAEHHDWLYIAEEVKEKLKNTPLDKLEDTLEKWIKKGHIRTNKWNIKLPEEIITILKEKLEEVRNIEVMFEMPQE